MENRRLSVRKLAALFLTGLILILSFQNCSRSVDFNKVDEASLKAETDDGRPYEGKIFVLLGDACSDGTQLKARIAVKSSVLAYLERVDCAEIAPLALSSADFQINTQNESELIYQNQVFINALVGTPLDMSMATSDGGFAFKINGVFGPAPDSSTSPNQSLLQMYEDGKPLNPPHSVHQDIRDIGLGRYSHRTGLPWGEALRWSASDNTDPRTNGRTYTWDVRR